MVSPATIAASTQVITLPDIPELYDPNFLDVLIPAVNTKERDVTLEAPPAPRNPMMDALLSTAHQTLTENNAPAYDSTGSPTLDAFQLLAYYSRDAAAYKACLDKAWAEDPGLTLRLIWNIRSIHDGKAEKDPFYQAFGWLYDHHPRTAISNLHLLVEPVCKTGKSKQLLAHGYWKDLLNILALATVDELHTPSTSTFLHAEKDKFIYNKWRRKDGTPEHHIRLSLQRGEKNKLAAKEKRKEAGLARHKNLLAKLADTKYRALYIAIARLFSERLRQDLDLLAELNALAPNAKDQRLALQKQISLAGKWAPTPAGSHDRHTNISTAISLLLQRAQTPSPYPTALIFTSFDSTSTNSMTILRSFFQRWVLTPLRSVSRIPEPLMCARRWTEIRYGRVSAVCMRNNTDAFFRHDPTGFEAYLVEVENGRRGISGATLLPHELVAEVYALRKTVAGAATSEPSGEKKKKNTELADAKRRVAEMRLRVLEQQWGALVERLRESGTLDSAIAVCDVSGSMGSLGMGLDKRNVLPIFPAVALSLILAHLARPPFDAGFITFSADPQFVRLDLEQPLVRILEEMVRGEWGLNTDLEAVFGRLLLPLAVENKVRREDMIKRVFVFSDMQFDEATGAGANMGMGVGAEEEMETRPDPAKWETNYDGIEKAYKEAGYDVPQVVFWDVRRYGSAFVHATVEVQAERKGVALMNGFSPAMLKVFMGEEEEEGWEKVGQDGMEEGEDEFNPFNVMRKALTRRSFNGLVVVD
ncbi:hypothetical protein BDZ94DRAFT_1283329 [Collybia nuda]|uniref:Uncharacterized protein n=1 Tax=Collybia nuda TaxID=64659 RepID=A0A9P5Y3X4_9AGAR|nr:hypothetical protein BDZ94DRAFT_1283329 [Collybia nuda]